MDTDEIKALPPHIWHRAKEPKNRNEKIYTSHGGSHGECKVGVDQDTVISDVYTSEPIAKCFQQKTYDAINYSDLCCWLAIAMMINSHDKEAASKMISLISTKPKDTFSDLTYGIKGGQSAVKFFHDYFCKSYGKHHKMQIGQVTNVNNIHELNDYVKNIATGCIVCFLQDNKFDTNHAVCIDLKRQKIYDSAEEYVMNHSKEALDVCVGAGRTFQHFYGVIVMKDVN